MVAVSDTSPISNLAFIGQLDLLRSQFGEIWIPESVRAELEKIPDREAKAHVVRALEAGWLQCRAVMNIRLAAALANDLDKGEAEAIALATEVDAEVLLIDEKEGRDRARQAGLPVRGVLGILLRAKATGDLSSIKPHINALRSRAGFFIAPALEVQVLQSAGE